MKPLLTMVRTQYCCGHLRVFEELMYECILKPEHDGQHIGHTKKGTLYWGED